MRRHLPILGLIGLLATACSAATPTPTPDVHHCEVWREIRSWVAENGEVAPLTKEGWDERIALTERLVAATPEGYREQGQIYLNIVYDRAELLAAYDYVPVMQLPADVREAFIQEHFADQQIANEFMRFMASECVEDTNA